MRSNPPNSFLCGASQNYVHVPFLTKWFFTWPFVRLELETDSFVLGPPRFLRWSRRGKRLRYEEVAEAWIGSKFPPLIRLRLTDLSRGTLEITTLNEGVLELADRLQKHGVSLREPTGFAHRFFPRGPEMIFRRSTAPRRGHVSSGLLLFVTLTILLAGAITLVLAILSFVRGDSAVTSITLLFGSCIVFGFVELCLTPDDS